ncbi:metallophosphoesterase [Niabella aquatica]
MSAKLCSFILALLLLLTERIAAQVSRFVIIPDPQNYIESFPEMYEEEIGWIASKERDFDYVIHVGDMTQNNSPSEWYAAKKIMDKLNGKIPFTMALGNHDMGSAPGKASDVRNSSMANKYFPLEGFKKNKTFGGAFEDGKIDNMYNLLNAGGVKWMIMTLEFGPRNAVLDWANKIADQYPDRAIIVNTHAYLYSDSTLMNNDHKWQPASYGIGKSTGDAAANNGARIWEKLVSQHPNILMVVCGHVLNSGVGTLVSTGKHGNKVFQMLANFQGGVIGSQRGGNGYIRIVEYNRKTKVLDVKTYSTHLKKYHESPHHNFLFSNVELNTK